MEDRRRPSAGVPPTQIAAEIAAGMIEDVTRRSQVRSDGRTVWVDVSGHTVGRFSQFGVDIHLPDSSGCLDCSHTRPTVDDWVRFVFGMLEHHDVQIPDRHMPRFLR